MSKSLLDLSGKIDPPLVEVFEAIAGVLAARNIRYFVVGATARDMILSHGHGIAIKRATADIDLGVEVADWEEFHALKDGLAATGQFEPTRSAQRLLYKHDLPVDIVPFGPHGACQQRNQLAARTQRQHERFGIRGCLPRDLEKIKLHRSAQNSKIPAG